MPDISHILADRSRTLLFFKKKCLKSADHPLLRVFYFFTFFFRSHSYTPFASVTHLLNPGTDISPELCYILPIFHKTLRAARYFLSCAENSAVSSIANRSFYLSSKLREKKTPSVITTLKMSFLFRRESRLLIYLFSDRDLRLPDTSVF